MPLNVLAHHHERAVGGAGAEVDVGQPALATAAAVFNGQHYEVESVHRFHLAPCLAPPTRLVRGVGSLHHHSLMALGNGLFEDHPSLIGIVSHHSGYAVFGGNRIEMGQAADQRFVEKIGAVAMHAIEKHRGQLNRGGSFGVFGAKAAHCVLERTGSEFLVEPDYLSIQGERVGTELSHYVDDFGESFGDVVEIAGSRCGCRPGSCALGYGLRRVSIRLMPARARRLRWPRSLPSRRALVGSPMQHEADGVEARSSVGESYVCGLAEITRQHQGPAH